MRIYKYILFLLLLYVDLYPIYSDYWRYQNTISLKKEKYFSATLVQKLDRKAGVAKKDLHIKWTSYIDGRLTMQVNLDKVNHQFNLKLSENEFAFKLPLFQRQRLELEAPYLIIRFVEYNKKKSTATLKLFIRNTFRNIALKQGK
ncbi:hypothetical protein MNB_ARC-1_831 [hydrothermal vent metagenome]|uniref:Uncharacterized protein n=1 Tax=hydrothermal vent metagenome TaxID=652676 RepID=A0A3B1E456_9ZZZZ